MDTQTEDKTYDEVKEQMTKISDFILELDNLPAQNHLWTDRGAKMTCENAGHEAHEAWKRRK